MKRRRNNLLIRITAMAFMAMAAILNPSCDSLIYADLDPCPRGVRLRFVYDYNMEFANAFPSQVDCLTLLVYDGEGRYVKSFTQTTDELLSDENWRLVMPLDPGDYTFEAWGGMACTSSSFRFNADPQSQPLRSLEVMLDSGLLTSPRGNRLHPLFFGRLDITVPEESMDYVDGTVKMMKDTNNIRLTLNNLNGTPISGDEFVFSITDNNTLLDWDNNVVDQPDVTYSPWTWGQSVVGEYDGGAEATFAYAEISTSRLMADSKARLRIQRSSDMSTIVDIPLIKVLERLRSNDFDYLDTQEFLDRESRWEMMFFIADGIWLDVYIMINDYQVRVNDIIFE